MNYILQQIWERKLVFFGTFFIVFTISYIILIAFDFVPEAPVKQLDSTVSASVATSSVATSTEKELEAALPDFPVTITIKKIDKTISVLNPDSRDIADLDAALLDGVVRHPDSATLSQEGNVFILGHSSYLPNVINSNFQAFNGIQDLEWGDEIEVSSNKSVYRYRVERVYRANAQDVTVSIAGTEKRLTLATCNSFGSSDDRYIVEAKQIAANKL